MPSNDQITDTFIMVHPTHFGYNPQTADTNQYQNSLTTIDQTTLRAQVFFEFESMVKTLKLKGLNILVLESPTEITPDAIFPNNWFSHHDDNTLILYPMLAPNRRLERQPSQLISLLKKNSINSINTINLSSIEQEGYFLEGTGSLVLDRVHRIAFAVLSPRTTLEALNNWCPRMQYEPVVFHAYDENQRIVYHTNIVMSVGNGFAVVTMEGIKDQKEQDTLIKTFQKFGTELIPITTSQMNSFCGNILHVKTKSGRAIILSQAAYEAFTKQQKKQLLKYGNLIPVSIPTIETVGGGSARCLLAEIFP